MEGFCSSCNPNVFEIFTGQDKDMPMRVVSQPSGLPLDLTECTAITIALPNADGTFTDLTLLDSQISIVTPALAGQIIATITAAESVLFNVGERQSIDASFTIGGLITIVRFLHAFSVLESPL
jgi:hypothetical protein